MTKRLSMQDLFSGKGDRKLVQKLEVQVVIQSTVVVYITSASTIMNF